jgi:phosphodiesterase/alkaline phosphatase D-like protein
VLYSVNINTGSQYVTFSKTSGIAAGETVTMSVAGGAPTGTVMFNVSVNTSPTASNGPLTGTRAVQVTAAVEPDPTFSGFNHTVPTNTQQGQSHTVTFSGTSSSNGRPVWYSLSPQSGLSFSKLDNISAGEAVTLTIGGSATGTLAVTVYANTTKNNGSKFTKSVGLVQIEVTVY